MGETITNACLAALVGSVLTSPRTPFARLLDTRPMAAQQPFFSPTRGDWATAFPINVIGAIAAGLALHYGVERPVMALRSRITRRIRSRTLALATGALR